MSLNKIYVFKALDTCCRQDI